MYIKRLQVHGFRSLKDITLNFQPGFNVLVGKNNSGKSNIILALDYLLGEKYPTYREVENRTFYRKNSKDQSTSFFSIVARLGGREMNETQISSYTKSTKACFTSDAPNWNDLGRWISELEHTQSIWWKSSDLIQNLKNARGIFVFLYVPRSEEEDEDVTREDKKYGLIIKSLDGWFLLPSLSKKICDALLTTAYIPSFRDPYQQLKINQYSWYGKLIRYLYGRKNDGQTIRIETLQTDLSEAVQDVFRDVSSSVGERLAKAVFHHKISFQGGTFTHDDSYKQITLYIDDGIDAPYYEKGSGIQSALIIALFSLYCNQFHKGSSLLLVEEPEIYLHPQARRSIEAQLIRFVKGEAEDQPNPIDEQYISERQVIISTHSTEFLRSAQVSHISLIQKGPGCTDTCVAQFDARNPKSGQIIETENAEMFFADFVILVEGGEKYILPPLADQLVGNGDSRWLDSLNVSVARVNGKGQFKVYTELLDNFKIPWVILTDLDFLQDGIDHFNKILDQQSRDSLSRVMQNWQILASQVKVRGKLIKEKVFSPEIKDWRLIYQEVETAIQDIGNEQTLSVDRIREIENLWTRLKSRVEGKIDYQLLRTKCLSDIEIVLACLQKSGIFVFSQGELEDHLPSQHLEVFESQGKDRCALAFSEILGKEEKPDWLYAWIISNKAQPFCLLLNHVESKLKLLKGLNADPIEEDEIPF